MKRKHRKACTFIDNHEFEGAVFFDLHLNKRLSEQEAGDLRRHCANYYVTVMWFLICDS